MKEELLNKEYGNEIAIKRQITFNNLNPGKSVMKHHIQNSSLLAHLAGASLTSDNSTFVEFGSGRAALSYWLGKVTCILIMT